MRAPCLPLLGLLLLLVPVRGVAAGPSSAWQAGKAIERAGEPARALDRYLGALEGRRDGRVLRAAQSVAPAAVDQLFASAGAAELELLSGDTNAQEIVLQLFIDDGVASRGHRVNLMKPEFTFMGARSGPHGQYNHMTVINYAGGMTTNNFQALEPVGAPASSYPSGYTSPTTPAADCSNALTPSQFAPQSLTEGTAAVIADTYSAIFINSNQNACPVSSCKVMDTGC